jgi:pimeloyl-ACP methyl ester carboxylesterase
MRLRDEEKHAAFVQLHRLLGQVDFAEALSMEDVAAYRAWKATPNERLIFFVDFLDEAALGRDDAITPAVTAWDLPRAWPQATLQIVPDAGHASSEPGNLRRMMMATERFAHYE